MARKVRAASDASTASSTWTMASTKRFKLDRRREPSAANTATSPMVKWPVMARLATRARHAGHTRARCLAAHPLQPGDVLGKTPVLVILDRQPAAMLAEDRLDEE
jgi:hypothetical protein